jgi:hypothetical protein
MPATRHQFEVLRNGRFVGYVSARSQAEAVNRAGKRYGRCEVIAAYRAPFADVYQTPDSHRTEGRRPCNNTAEGKARIEAIRQAAIAEYAAR